MIKPRYTPLKKHLVRDELEAKEEEKAPAPQPPSVEEMPEDEDDSDDYVTVSE